MPRVASTLITIAFVLLSWPAPQIQREAIPFVGCPAEGQVGPIQPPQGEPRIVALDGALARSIAYYKGEEAPGVFAPRGWHCRVWYGSGGSTILVTPIPIDSKQFSPPTINAPAVEIELLDGGTSGRFGVARYASRLFPKVAAKFIERVESEGLEPASEFEQRPYAHDAVTYPDTLVAEFTTPANKIGLGTEGILQPSQDPISGIAVLDPSGDWSLSILRVRLGPNLRQVRAAILRLSRPCMQATDAC